MARWAEIGRRFAALRLEQQLHPRVLDYLAEIQPERPLLVACSGGADSVYLLLALCAHFGDSAGRLRVAHFNHRIRGAEADADAAFVADMAAGLGLPCETGTPSSPLPPDEAALRAARYQWLTGAYARCDAAGLLLGHHADDLLESLLMGVLTGSGPASLAAPQPVKRFPDGHVRLRPLLRLRREEIMTALESLGIPWRVDASNTDLRYTRNWLRRDIIPLLRARFPQDPTAGVARTRERMEACVDLLDHLVAGLGIDTADPLGFEVGPLSGQHREVVRRAFMGWWLRHHPEDLLPTASLDTLVALLQQPPRPVRVSVREGLSFFIEGGRLHLRHTGATPPILFWTAATAWHWPAGPLWLPDGACLRAQRIDMTAASGAPAWKTANPAAEAWLDCADPTLTVRPWLPGDRYQPLGAPGRRKLQDLFTDAKLDPASKARLPVILNRDGLILWVPGFPPNHAHRLAEGTNSALRLTYHPH